MGSTLLTPTHLILLLLVALLLFGAKRLPEIGRSLGTGMREFKDSVTTSTSDTKVETHSELPPPVATAPVASAPVAPAPVPAGPPAPEAAPAAAPAPADTEREAEPVS
jgi:sec-independent protein translocase protein TatA